MKHQNIDNLTSLWLLAAEPFAACRQQDGFNVVELDFSAWPNRIWYHGEKEKYEVETVKDILQESFVQLTYSTWNELQCDEHQEVDESGLILKSTQIGMSLSLQKYNVQQHSNIVSLDKVDTEETVDVWSDVFRQCFGYSISSRIIEAIKDKVSFYLINDGLGTVGCVASYVKDNQIGIHSLGVLSTYRKQGFAETAMHILLQDAKTNGLSHAHLQSSMLGVGIYRKIGFEEIFKMCNLSARS